MAELDPYSVSISLSTMLSLTCTFKVKITQGKQIVRDMFPFIMTAVKR